MSYDLTTNKHFLNVVVVYFMLYFLVLYSIPKNKKDQKSCIFR